MPAIRITPRLTIDEEEIRISFVRASGPGGQNVNKVSTAAELRFDAANSPGLPDEVKQRLATLAGRRMTNDGVVVIFADRFRTQERNRDDATQRLIELIARAAERPKRRIATRPTKGSKERRLAEKQHRSTIKRGRGGDEH